jgi:hypothetical protein
MYGRFWVFTEALPTGAFSNTSAGDTRNSGTRQVQQPECKRLSPRATAINLCLGKEAISEEVLVVEIAVGKSG